MASKSIFAFVILLVLLCLFLMREPSSVANYCTAYGCLGATVAGTGTKEILNRKVLSVFKNKRATLKARVQGSLDGKYGEKSVSWELRKVPSGPDPLHHNGGCKPETP